MSPGLGRASALPAWIALTVGIGLLAFLLRPVLAVAQEPMSGLDRYVLVSGLALFIAIYFWAGPLAFVRRVDGRPALAAALLGTLAMAIALDEHDVNWTILFVAAAVVASAILPSRRALAVIALLAVLAAVARVAATGTLVGIVESSFAVVISGLVVLSVSRLDRTTRSLNLAQAEIARLATAAERARIARDVHDLLGHSLSVIVLKAELARRILERDPGRASAELRDIESVARASLRDVRETVAGYRRVTLSTELAGAHVALDAAGIDVEVRQSATIRDATVDELFGWIVREGVTNVVRHSGGARCTIRIDTVDQGVRLEIIDDGALDRSQPVGPGSTGIGLSGIRERLEAAGGHLEAGPLARGGYRLAAIARDGTGLLPIQHALAGGVGSGPQGTGARNEGPT